MEFRSLIRPAAQLVSTSRTALPLIPQRGHKTTARTKRSLKIAPHDSFLPDRSAAFPAADSIIYNPPASEASVEHTPFLFLPRNDPRRTALFRLRNSPGAPASLIPGAVTTADLPPQMQYKHRNPKYNLSQEQIEEIRALRKEDPLKWSVNKLAQKFECSPVFIQIASPAPAEHTKWLKEKLERKMARWGPKKTQAREDRKRRTEMMYRGEL